MAEGLWKRVQVILKEIGVSSSRLKELMSDRGLKYDPPYMDSFASPDDIRVIAKILGVPASRLFEATNLVGELVEAVFEEEWSKYEISVGIPRQEARKRVDDSEFRWTPSRSTIRGQVILDSLVKTRFEEVPAL